MRRDRESLPTLSFVSVWGSKLEYIKANGRTVLGSVQVGVSFPEVCEECFDLLVERRVQCQDFPLNEPSFAFFAVTLVYPRLFRETPVEGAVGVRKAGRTDVCNSNVDFGFRHSCPSEDAQVCSHRLRVFQQYSVHGSSKNNFSNWSS